MRRATRMRRGVVEARARESREGSDAELVPCEATESVALDSSWN